MLLEFKMNETDLCEPGEIWPELIGRGEEQMTGNISPYVVFSKYIIHGRIASGGIT